jgi:hypothetical protein
MNTIDLAEQLLNAATVGDVARIEDLIQVHHVDVNTRDEAVR